VKAKVLIQEPDKIRRHGIVVCLQDNPECEVIGSGTDIFELLRKSSLSYSDQIIFLVNIDCSISKIVRYWALLRSLYPCARIVAFTDGSDERVLEMALASSFNALHRHDIDPGGLREIVSNVIHGVVDYDEDLLWKLKQLLLEPGCRTGLFIDDKNAYSSFKRVEFIQRLHELTCREKQVLEKLSKGLTNRQIGLELKIAERTVEFHVTNLLKKLGVPSRLEAGLMMALYRYSSYPT